MKEHYDIEDKKLEKGFIYKSTRSKTIYYFTGKYNRYEEASFENMEGGVVEFVPESSALLKKLKKREIEKIIRWLERGLEE